MAEIPAISDVPFGSPDIIRELKLAVDTLAGRIGGNVDYGTIDGVRTKVLDIVHLCNMGRIKARAYRNAAQDINALPSPRTKVLIDTISIDTESVIDIANSRIRPNLPGYYVVMGSVASFVPDGERVNALIYKNSVTVLSHGTSGIQGAAGLVLSSASDLVYMNGTTDYLELYAYNTHSSALKLYVGHSYNNYISILGPF